MNLPPIRQLQYLVALREELHFGRAASSLNVTQSTLSTGIRELESFLSITLVERTSKSVTFTKAGEDIVDRARYIMMQVEDLVTEARVSQTRWRCPSNWAPFRRSRPIASVTTLTSCSRHSRACNFISEKIPAPTSSMSC